MQFSVHLVPRGLGTCPSMPRTYFFCRPLCTTPAPNLRRSVPRRNFWTSNKPFEHTCSLNNERHHKSEYQVKSPLKNAVKVLRQYMHKIGISNMTHLGREQCMFLNLHVCLLVCALIVHIINYFSLVILSFGNIFCLLEQMVPYYLREGTRKDTKYM